MEKFGAEDGGGTGGKAGGAKRKASDNFNERTDGAVGATGQRKTKNVKVAPCRIDGAVSLHGTDLLSKIACFMPPGIGLMSICVVAGRAGAGHIQQEYLTDNDEYVSHSLRRLTDHLATCCKKLPYSMIRTSNRSFDKCRDDIRAWMQCNEWKSRCTASNAKRYEKHETREIPIP